MHKVWSNNPLGSEPAENGVPRIEIDESEIIGNQNNKIWMFGLIDRVDKEARVFCVMNTVIELKRIFYQLLREMY